MARQRFIDGCNVCVRTVQIFDVAVHKLLEVFGSVRDIGDVCPFVEVLLRVVQSPPGIEPFASVYSKILIDYTFTALSFMKAIELALHQIHRFS